MPTPLLHRLRWLPLFKTQDAGQTTDWKPDGPQDWRQGLNAWLAQLPSLCASCQRWTRSRLCPACWLAHAPPQLRCLRCAQVLPASALPPSARGTPPSPVPAPHAAETPSLAMAHHPICGQCLTSPPPLSRCIATVDYAGLWRRVMAAYKFHDEVGWTRHLCHWMHKASGAAQTLGDAELLLPIPLSNRRLAERGYNTAGLLAQGLDARRTKQGLLLRVRETPSQRGLHRSERVRNVRGVLAIDPLQQERIENRRLLLIDDVMTTGATLHEAARVLRAAGAADVSALVFARTPQEA